MLFEAIFGNHEPRALGEQAGTCMLVAQNQRAAKGVAFRYIRDFLRRAPILSSRIQEVLASSVLLTSGLTIECLPSTSDAPRGYAMPVAVLDEIGVWRLDGQADADVEILAAIQPRAEKIVMIGTPFLTSGVLYEQSRGASAWTIPTPSSSSRRPLMVMVPHLAEKIAKRRALNGPHPRPARVRRRVHRGARRVSGPGARAGVRNAEHP